MRGAAFAGAIMFRGTKWEAKGRQASDINPFWGCDLEAFPATKRHPKLSPTVRGLLPGTCCRLFAIK